LPPSTADAAREGAVPAALAGAAAVVFVAVPVEAGVSGLTAGAAAEVSVADVPPVPVAGAFADVSVEPLCAAPLWLAVSLAATRDPPHPASNATVVTDAVTAVTSRRGLVLADICLPFERAHIRATLIAVD
jgi:hypothetical protein